MKTILLSIFIAITSFANSKDVIIKQELSKDALVFSYNEKQDRIYSISFPIEIIVHNTTNYDARIMSMGCYYLTGYNGINKKWWSNLTIYERKGSNLIWEGGEWDIFYIEPLTSKKYVVYTEHTINNDATFKKRFRSIVNEMKMGKRAQQKIDIRSFTKKQIRYLKKRIVNDSIRIDMYFNNNRHRDKFRIDTDKVIYKQYF